MVINDDTCEVIVGDGVVFEGGTGSFSDDHPTLFPIVNAVAPQHGLAAIILDLHTSPSV